MKNYSIKNHDGETFVKPYNTNRACDKTNATQLLRDFASGNVTSERELVKFARKVLNVNTRNARIDRNEYLIKTVKELLADEVEVGDYGTKYDFVDVISQMRRDGVFDKTRKDISTTTITFLALDELVNDGIFNKKRIRTGKWKDCVGDIHYRYETVYGRVR